MLNDFNSWKESTKGVYRNVIAASACYEIMILRHNFGNNLLKDRANLYISGEWNSKDGDYYERALLYTGTVKECLDAALKDYNDHVDLC